MAVWTETIRLRHPDVKFGSYLDDRTIWALGEGGHIEINRALQLSKEIDTTFEMKEHPKKREWFGNTDKVLEKLKWVSGDNANISKTFTLLGVFYGCDNRTRTWKKEERWEQAKKRCDKIKKAIDKPKRRKILVRSLVLPKVLWASAWERPPKNQMKTLRTHIERTIRYKRGHRETHYMGSRSK